MTVGEASEDRDETEDKTEVPVYDGLGPTRGWPFKVHVR